MIALMPWRRCWGTSASLGGTEIVELAKAKSFDGESVKAGEILAWLKDEFALGRGHGMALVHVIKRGPQIDAKHVGTSGTHRDETDTLWLDGVATKPD